MQKSNHRETVKLDKLRNLHINQFWKKLKNKLQKKVKVQVDIDQLKIEFQKIFNDKLNKSDDILDVIKVNEFNTKTRKLKLDYELNDDVIKEIISDLNTNI